MTKVLRLIVASWLKHRLMWSHTNLKVTTYDNKVTKLAVDKIEEVTVDGKTLYKVTAKAPDLVQHTNGNELSEEYVHYFAKPKSHEEQRRPQYNRAATQYVDSEEVVKIKRRLRLENNQLLVSLRSKKWRLVYDNRYP